MYNSGRGLRNSANTYCHGLLTLMLLLGRFRVAVLGDVYIIFHFFLLGWGVSRSEFFLFLYFSLLAGLYGS